MSLALAAVGDPVAGTGDGGVDDRLVTPSSGCDDLAVEFVSNAADSNEEGSLVGSMSEGGSG